LIRNAADSKLARIPTESRGVPAPVFGLRTARLSPILKITLHAIPFK
jgi:hypothetical protein